MSNVARLVRLALISLTLVAPQLGAAAPEGEARWKALQAEARAKVAVVPTDPPSAAFADAAALPTATITGPGAVGEALHVPARAGDAVVSLLGLLRASIVADGADDPPRPGLVFTQSEVRLLIAMAEEDAGRDDDEGPASFADLHDMVEPFLPGVSAEKLAAAYARAYEAHPEALVPQVMLGQPIEPDMSLSRVQLWLLLVDGFSVPASAPNVRGAALDRGREAPTVIPAVWRTGGGGPHLRRVAATGSGASGTARQAVASLSKPVAGFTPADVGWFLAHVQTLLGRIPFELAPRGAAAHEGHGGTGKPVQMEFRLRGGRAPLVRTPSGKVVFTPKAQPGPFRFQWGITSAGLNLLRAHGTVSARFGEYQLLAPGAVAGLEYVPKKEVANGRGDVFRELVSVAAEIDGKSAIDALYDSSFGYDRLGRRASAAREIESSEGRRHVRLPNPTFVARLQLEWHAHPGLRIQVSNVFDVVLNSPIGGGRSHGVDDVSGELERQPDGSYRGLVWARSLSIQSLAGLGRECTNQHDGRQLLRVEGREVPKLNENQSLDRLTAPADQKKRLLRLRFWPASQPVYATWHVCEGGAYGLVENTDRTQTYSFMPFQDWYWQHDGYVILLPEKGELKYEDLSQAPIRLGAFAKDPTTGAGAPVGLVTATGFSTWWVTVELRDGSR